MLKTKSLALILSTSFLHPLFSLSTNFDKFRQIRFFFQSKLLMHLCTFFTCSYICIGVFLSLVVEPHSEIYFTVVSSLLYMMSILFIALFSSSLLAADVRLALFPLSVNKCPLVINGYISDLRLPHSVSWAMFCKLYCPLISS